MCAIETTALTGPEIGTERLTLRRPLMSDAGALVAFANDFNVAAMLSTMPHPYGPKEAEDFLSKEIDWDRAPNFAIVHREFGYIGGLGFQEKAPGRTEVGYWLGRPFWGRGYATEALKAAVAWARDGWGKQVLYAGHFTENRASGAVLVKAGFLYTGDVEPWPCLARGRDVPTRMMVRLA